MHVVHVHVQCCLYVVLYFVQGATIAACNLSDPPKCLRNLVVVFFLGGGGGGSEGFLMCLQLMLYVPFEKEEKECLSKFSVPNFILALFIQLWPEAVCKDAREAREDFRVCVHDCTVAVL